MPQGTMEGRARGLVSSRHAPLLVFAFGVLLLLPSIWSETSVTDPDEYWRSLRTPLEMLERGSWLTPWLDGQPRLRKPPLLYWAILLNYTLFGVSLLAARIWGVLCGAGLALCSCLIFRELFNGSGVPAGLITLASVGVAYQSRIAMLDVPLGLFTALAVLFALRWGRTGRWRWILFSAASLGGSFLVKGPVGFVFFAAAAVPALWVYRRWRFVLSRMPQLMGGLALLVAICLPWPLAMWVRWPHFSEIVGQELAARHLGDLSAGFPLAVLGGAVGLVFPWSPVLVAAAARALGRARDPMAREERWLVAWYLGGTIPFFFMRTFEWYLIPMVPAMGVLCANWLRDAPESSRGILMRLSLLMAAAGASVLCVLFLWFGLGPALVAFCLCLVGTILWIAFTRPDSSVGMGAVAMLLTGLLGGMYPSLGVNALPADLRRVIGPAPVAVYGSDQPVMLSVHLGRNVVPMGSQDAEGRLSLQRHAGFIFIEEDGEFVGVAKALGLRSERVGEFKTLYWRGSRLGRKDATLEDWKTAIRTRSLEGLRSRIRFYRTSPQQGPDESRPIGMSEAAALAAPIVVRPEE